jgi:hypothetical protein
MIYYEFNWGDGETTNTEFLPSGTDNTQTHIWTSPGDYTITVVTYDDQGVPSETTEYTVTIHDSIYNNTTGFEIIIVFIAIMMIFLIIRRKNRFYK